MDFGFALVVAALVGLAAFALVAAGYGAESRDGFTG
jgi:hypothetical protein